MAVGAQVERTTQALWGRVRNALSLKDSPAETTPISPKSKPVSTYDFLSAQLNYVGLRMGETIVAGMEVDGKRNLIMSDVQGESFADSILIPFPKLYTATVGRNDERKLPCYVSGVVSRTIFDHLRMEFDPEIGVGRKDWPYRDSSSRLPEGIFPFSRIKKATLFYQPTEDEVTEALGKRTPPGQKYIEVKNGIYDHLIEAMIDTYDKQLPVSPHYEAYWNEPTGL